MNEILKLKAALSKVLRHFPTDSDMIEAGWTPEQVEAACQAYEDARRTLGVETYVPD